MAYRMAILSVAFGAYSSMRQALTQWGCARKLYAAVRVRMQCTCMKIKMSGVLPCSIAKQE